MKHFMLGMKGFNMNDWKDKKKTTLSGRPAELSKDSAAPAPIDESTGMHKDYWVLPEEERAKGFVRPLRQTYVHVGIRPKYKLRDLTDEEKKRFNNFNYVKHEKYPESESSQIGRYWTQRDLDSGCSTSTKMGLALSETYARDPKYYGSTFCCQCKTHFSVGEFIWEGTNERVGS